MEENEGRGAGRVREHEYKGIISLFTEVAHREAGACVSILTKQRDTAGK